MILELSQQAIVPLLEFANCRLRSGFGHALSAFNLRHSFAGLVEDFTFTLLHSEESVGTDCFHCSVSFS
jgi:hypothetical protein